MGAFAQWLIGLVKSSLTWLYNHGIDFVQSGMDGFVSFIISIVGLLPAGPSMPSLPAVPEGSMWALMVQTINWLFPVQFLLSASGFLVTGMLIYVGVGPLTRWLKLHS